MGIIVSHMLGGNTVNIAMGVVTSHKNKNRRVCRVYTSGMGVV